MSKSKYYRDRAKAEMISTIKRTLLLMLVVFIVVCVGSILPITHKG